MSDFLFFNLLIHFKSVETSIKT